MIERRIVIPIAPPAIPGIGTTGGFEFWIQDTGTGDPVALDGVLQDFLKKARERPELTGLATTYSASTQQLRASVDREKTQLLGIPIQDVYSAIQAQFGSLTRQPVQPVLQRLVGGHPVGRAIPAESRGPDAPVHAQQPEPDGAAVVGGIDAMDRRSRPAAALQRLHRGQDQRQCVRGVQLGRRDRDDGGGGQGSAAAGLRVRVVRACRTRRRNRAARRGSRSCSASSSCSWCWPRSTSRGRCRAR